MAAADIENLDYVLSSNLFNLVETSYRKSEQDFSVLKNYLVQKGLRTIYLAPSAIYQMKLDLNSLDENERKKAVAALKDFISRAYFLNAEKLLICSGQTPDWRIGKRQKATSSSLSMNCWNIPGIFKQIISLN